MHIDIVELNRLVYGLQKGSLQQVHLLVCTELEIFSICTIINWWVVDRSINFMLTKDLLFQNNSRIK